MQEQGSQQQQQQPQSDESDSNDGGALAAATSFFSNAGSIASSIGASVAASVPSAETVKKAGWFFGSFIGTAAPALGRKLGIEALKDFDHWTWIENPSDGNSSSSNSPGSSSSPSSSSPFSGGNSRGGGGGSGLGGGSQSSGRTGGVILSALPVVSEIAGSGDHLKLLKTQAAERGSTMGLVVSVMEEQEMEGFGVSPVKFATHEEWRKEFPSIETVLYKVTDCSADGMTFENMSAVISKMNEHVRAGRSVLVHCKAGKGRSAVAVMCYLIRYRNHSVSSAVTLVKALRGQINPSESQLNFVAEYFTQLQEERARAAKAVMEQNNRS